jgi:uncharacterized protein (TIGR02391 family)
VKPQLAISASSRDNGLHVARRKNPETPEIEPRVWQSADEIDRAIAKLQRRISDMEQLNVRESREAGNTPENVAVSNVKETIREVFGQNSPEFREHEHIRMWSGVIWTEMEEDEIVQAKERARKNIIGVLNGLIRRLNEKKEELGHEHWPTPKSYLDHLNLHPRIADVATELFQDGYPWQAVFEASKALVNYVKERSGEHNLDGTGLVRSVFSKNNPVLAFNDLQNQTDLDEQEGMMHLFEGAILGIRNPGGHSFPEGPEQRAVEYLSLISLLAYRVQEAKRRRPSP